MNLGCHKKLIQTFKLVFTVLIDLSLSERCLEADKEKLRKRRWRGLLLNVRPLSYVFHSARPHLNTARVASPLYQGKSRDPAFGIYNSLFFGV